MTNAQTGLVVTITQVDDSTIWINSNQDPIGKEVVFTDIQDVESQMMISIADYFDLDLEFEEIEDEEDSDELDDEYYVDYFDVDYYEFD